MDRGERQAWRRRALYSNSFKGAKLEFAYIIIESQTKQNYICCLKYGYYCMSKLFEGRRALICIYNNAKATHKRTINSYSTNIQKVRKFIIIVQRTLSARLHLFRQGVDLRPS
jgi:hypothetical protein